MRFAVKKKREGESQLRESFRGESLLSMLAAHDPLLLSRWPILHFPSLHESLRAHRLEYSYCKDKRHPQNSQSQINHFPSSATQHPRPATPAMTRHSRLEQVVPPHSAPIESADRSVILHQRILLSEKLCLLLGQLLHLGELRLRLLPRFALISQARAQFGRLRLSLLNSLNHR